MKPGKFREADDAARTGATPYLSYSRLNKYSLCPEQYRLYYVENLRPKIPSASLIFGQFVHQALAEFFTARTDPAQFFVEAWEGLKKAELDYGFRDSWVKLESVGALMLNKFVREEAPKIGKVQAVERVFELDITSLDLPFVGVIDLTAEVEGSLTVVDFKTAASAYEAHEAALSDQLTSYTLATPEAQRAALCVLIKTKEPRIEWYPTQRSPTDLAEFLSKAGYLAREIQAGHFYKRPGKWCGWCDYLPVCLRDDQRVKETLVQIQTT